MTHANPKSPDKHAIIAVYPQTRQQSISTQDLVPEFPIHKGSVLLAEKILELCLELVHLLVEKRLQCLGSLSFDVKRLGAGLSLRIVNAFRDDVGIVGRSATVPCKNLKALLAGLRKIRYEKTHVCGARRHVRKHVFGSNAH